jgi:hypothetical protein
MSHIADIVIAGNRAKANAEAAHQLGGISQIVFGIGAVDRHVAGMDDEIGPLVGNPCRERRPIVSEMRLAAAEMRVRDLDYAHSAPHRNAASSGIPPKTCVQPADSRRSA